MATQLGAKAMAALAQLYAMYIFSKILSKSDAALIFILLGYATWIQIFDFGLSQVIQNAIKLRIISISSACQIICIHYSLMLIIAVLALIFPELLDIFQGERKINGNDIDALAFPFGVALLLISTNNVLAQRLLLVVNRANVVSKLVFIQGVICVLVLIVLNSLKASLFESVIFYLFIPILTFAPLVFKIARKALRKRKKMIANWRWVVSKAIGFWGLTALSSMYLGIDYFYAARNLTNEEMISYHFASRLFFISYIAYFSYIQIEAKGISLDIKLSHPQHIWKVTTRAIEIGMLSVLSVVVSIIFIDWSGGLEMIGSQVLLDIPIILSAALYYLIRVIRDVGVVIVWNLGRQRLLYAIHILEVIFSYLLLNIKSTVLDGKEIFFAMAVVSSISAVWIFVALGRVITNSSR